MPAAAVTYRYAIEFPRVWDGQRPDWPLDILDKLKALPGFVDALLPELSAAWHPPTTSGVRRESRRRVIFLDITSATPAASDKTRASVYALIRDVKTMLAVTTPVTVTRWPVETDTV